MSNTQSETSSINIFKGLYKWYLQQPDSFFPSRSDSVYDFGVLMFIQKYIEFSYIEHKEDSMLMVLTYDYRTKEKSTSSTYLKLFYTYFDEEIKSNNEENIASGYKLKDEYIKEIYEYIYKDFFDSGSKTLEYYEIHRNKYSKKSLYKTSKGFVDTKKEAQEIEGLTRYTVDTLELSKPKLILDKKKARPHKTKFHIPNGYRKEKVFINKEHLVNILKNNEIVDSKEAMLYLSVLIKYELFPYVIYKKGNTGRLNSVTTINEKHYPILTNYQGIKKDYRKNIFKGFYEYDINTSAPVILSQLYEKEFPNKKKLKIVNEYIERKTEYRIKWAKKLFGDNEKENIKRIKSILTSLFFGASLEESYMMGKETKAHFTKDKEEEELDNLKSNSKFLKLVDEVETLYSSLSEKYLSHRKGTKSKRVTNILGITKEFKRSEKNKAIAHIYQGYEVKILLALYEKYEEDTVLLLHDAIFTKVKLDIDEVEKIAYEASGYSVKYEEEIIGE
ncbi:hypothetical protein PT520_12275 [Aliarcobacter butzleri]|uniref:DNA-directed DNA polymerase family A palm domain-containing protein n=1 Tax=Aliarcobacter butzleri TaxID=28197 RepID=A0AAW6VS98_9BACT|nr:hypothetical protein [Aliarcobacter butzleri]MDK2063290.1 hypothetical protein [Aliarcobacter butzleri]